MNCIVLHESSKRMRIHIPQARMSLREADIIEYFIKNLPSIKDAQVNDRTGNAIITFRTSTKEAKQSVLDAFKQFDYQDEKILALVPEETGRALNRKYEEEIVIKVMSRFLKKIFLPVPIATALGVIKSIPYYYKGVTTLMTKGLKVETLDAVAIGASMLRGDFATASSIMFMLDVGETLEEWTRKKSVGDLARTMSLHVDKVWVKAGEQAILSNVNQVHVGDHIILRTSNMIPLDGKVVSGEATVNQSTMTGESEPVIKECGSYVYAGTVVEEGECVVEVTKATGAGKYDQIVKMIEESEKLNSQTEAKAYHLADGLVPYSFAGAALTYLFTRNVTKALSFLMVDFSCAMKLSMPLSVLSAIREANDYSISVKGGKFMELISEADTIVFDKTGTLTQATPMLVDVVTFEDKDADEMLRIAACLEEHYPHSVANAIVNGAVQKNLEHEEIHSEVEYIVAHGVSSHIDHEKVVIGSYHFVIEDEGCVIPEDEMYKIDEIPSQYSRIFLAISGRLAAVLCIYDPVKKDAKDMIANLHTLGIINICMMTGDNTKTAKVVAEQLGLDDYYAEVLPEDKARYVKRKKDAGHKVIMIGDGVNDTPALSEADVGIAISDGAVIAREIADVTIASEDLMQLVTLRLLSDELMARIHNNYRFILGFNSALILLGLWGIITPASSALLHNGSTIVTGVRSMSNLLDDINE